MQRHELEAWLGDDWTPEQIDAIAEQYDRLAPLAGDDADEQEALLTAIAQQVDGTLDRDELAAADMRAQLAADKARRALRAAVRVDVADGMSEMDAHRRYGVNRLTVRKWLGKD